jgi:AraC-like DNA-binding protein
MLEILRRAVHPALAGHVAGSAAWAFAERGAPARRPELPHGGIVLVVSAGPLIEVDGSRYTALLAGLYDRPVVTGHDGEQAGVEVFLTPPGARRVLGMPLAELARRTVAPEDVLGRAGRELAERVAGAPSHTARLDVLEAWLRRRLRDAAPVRADVARAWGRIVAARGDIAMEDVRAELGCSRRHLATRFAEEVGLPPKAYARVVRFERASALLAAGRAPAEVAALCGYSDQAHLGREVAALADSTPGRLRAAAPVSAPVTDVQDAAGRAA